MSYGVEGKHIALIGNLSVPLESYSNTLRGFTYRRIEHCK